MKKICTCLSILLFSISLVACNNKAEKRDITIIYTNDIHGYIANTDVNDETKEGLRLSHVAGYVDNLKKQGENVLLVDAGDESISKLLR